MSRFLSNRSFRLVAMLVTTFGRGCGDFCDAQGRVRPVVAAALHRELRPLSPLHLRRQHQTPCVHLAGVGRRHGHRLRRATLWPGGSRQLGNGIERGLLSRDRHHRAVSRRKAHHARRLDRPAHHAGGHPALGRDIRSAVVGAAGHGHRRRRLLSDLPQILGETRRGAGVQICFDRRQISVQPAGARALYDRDDGLSACQHFHGSGHRRHAALAPCRLAETGARRAARTSANPETPACRHGHGRGRARRSGAGPETPFRD